MYGTIFNLNVKVGYKEELIKYMKSNSDTPDGMVAWFLMSPDDLSKDLVGVAAVSYTHLTLPTIYSM